jgi:hypothetical protein
VGKWRIRCIRAVDPPVIRNETEPAMTVVRHPFPQCAAWLAIASASACAPAFAAEAVHQVGVATAIGDGHLLYREHHYRFDDAGSPRLLVLYHCPDGTPFARKLLDEGPGASAPDVEFVDGRSGATESVRRRGNMRVVEVRKPDGSTKKGEVPERAGAVIDAGFDAVVRANWDRIDAEGAVVVPYLLPDRVQWLEFRVKLSGDEVDAGVRVRRIRMSLAMWFGAILPAIELTYDRDSRRLLRFRGPGYVRDARGKHPKVQIVFAAAPVAASAAEVAAARRVALTGRCPG